jgi:two-component system chemotaxis response regulator CheB
MPKIRVLIVDDAVVVRRILADALATDPEIEVTTAANGRIALAKIPQVNPDVVTMDVEMPELDGLSTVRELRKTHRKLPVIMFSTLTERGADATLDALAAGANDYVTKPANVGSVAVAISRVKDELLPKIKALCGRTAASASAAPSASIPPRPRLSLVRPSGPPDVVAIGVSTGGPNALSQIMPLLPEDFPVPIVIVQHMPPIFTKFLAERLDSQCQISVKEGAAGMPLKRGEALIAPGGKHMVVERVNGAVTASINDDPPENSCKPAVDVLFRSVVRTYGPRVLGVILTGMGADGLRGCEEIHQAGGKVIVQDEATSVVWGMPGFVSRAGLADKQLPLQEVPAEVIKLVRGGRIEPMMAAIK